MSTEITTAQEDEAVVREFMARQGAFDEVSAAQHANDSTATAGGLGSESAYELLAPDFYLVELEGFPYGGVFHGPQGYRDFAGVTGKYFEVVGLSEMKIHGAGDGNVFLTVGVSRKVLKTGKNFDVQEINWLKVKDGKITFLASFFNDTNVLHALWAEAEAES